MWNLRKIHLFTARSAVPFLCLEEQMVKLLHPQTQPKELKDFVLVE